MVSVVASDRQIPALLCDSLDDVAVRNLNSKISLKNIYIMEFVFLDISVIISLVILIKK